MDELKDLLDTIMSMEVGQALNIDFVVFNRLFKSSVVDPRPPEDQLLEKLPGVNYGSYKLRKDLYKNKYTIFRCEPGSIRVREDWDRR